MLLFLLLLILINSIQPVHQFLLFFPRLEETRVVSFVPVVEGRYVSLYMPDIILYLTILSLFFFLSFSTSQTLISMTRASASCPLASHVRSLMSIRSACC
ncbi:hypothetical protein FOXYSP1_17900 [Fusarium oxysporum f. sp. phaseoli]